LCSVISLLALLPTSPGRPPLEVAAVAAATTSRACSAMGTEAAVTSAAGGNSGSSYGTMSAGQGKRASTVALLGVGKGVGGEGERLPGTDCRFLLCLNLYFFFSVGVEACIGGWLFTLAGGSQLSHGTVLWTGLLFRAQVCA
jgi:hypothetical protein